MVREVKGIEKMSMLCDDGIIFFDCGWSLLNHGVAQRMRLKNGITAGGIFCVGI